MEVRKSYMPFLEPLYAKMAVNRHAGVEAAEQIKVYKYCAKNLINFIESLVNLDFSKMAIFAINFG